MPLSGLAVLARFEGHLLRQRRKQTRPRHVRWLGVEEGLRLEKGRMQANTGHRWQAWRGALRLSAAPWRARLARVTLLAGHLRPLVLACPDGQSGILVSTTVMAALDPLGPSVTLLRPDGSRDHTQVSSVPRHGALLIRPEQNFLHVCLGLEGVVTDCNAGIRT